MPQLLPPLHITSLEATSQAVYSEVRSAGLLVDYNKAFPTKRRCSSAPFGEEGTGRAQTSHFLPLYPLLALSLDLGTCWLAA